MDWKITHVLYLGDNDGGWSLWYLSTCDMNENFWSKACINSNPLKCSSTDEFLETTGKNKNQNFIVTFDILILYFCITESGY